jgi:hypothetical protein
MLAKQNTGGNAAKFFQGANAIYLWFVDCGSLPLLVPPHTAIHSLPPLLPAAAFWICFLAITLSVFIGLTCGLQIPRRFLYLHAPQFARRVLRRAAAKTRTLHKQQHTPTATTEPFKIPRMQNWCLKTPEAVKQACLRAVFP